jgi:hypothetical protein
MAEKNAGVSCIDFPSSIIGVVHGVMIGFFLKICSFIVCP